MASNAGVDNVLEKLRAERQAREKARIEKLRELNLKKYAKEESNDKSSSSANSFNKSIKIISNSNSMLHCANYAKNSQFNKSRLSTAPSQVNKRQTSTKDESKNFNLTNKYLNRQNKNVAQVKKDISINVGIEKELSGSLSINGSNPESDNTEARKDLNNDLNDDNVYAACSSKDFVEKKQTKTNLSKSLCTNKAFIFSKPKVITQHKNESVNLKSDNKIANKAKAHEGNSNFINRNISNLSNITKKRTMTNEIKTVEKKPPGSSVKHNTQNVRKNFAVNNNTRDSRKSIAANTNFPNAPKTSGMSRKSLHPQALSKSFSKANTESVFDRLYKPKAVPKKETSDAEKLRTDPEYLKKVIHDSGLIVNRRYTVSQPKCSVTVPTRRSISAVHFKRVNKSELTNCIHKWSSIGEKLDKAHLDEINEDENVQAEKIISAIKSERKKVQFQKPVAFNFNTPKPEELQSKLMNWLQKRGKSLDSFHHLQCFGIHHLKQNEIKPLNANKDEVKFDLDDDENKENIALDSDSDNGSYTENMQDRMDDFNDKKENIKSFDDLKWRRASCISNSDDLNDTTDTTLSSVVVAHHHVNELLLGALTDLTELLKEGFDWEQCARWLRAVRERFPSAPDTAAYWECRAALEERRGDLPASVQCWEEAIVKGTKRSVVESNLDQLLDKFMQLKISPKSSKTKQTDKLVDVKNVFKSTIIRFAVQQAKLRNSIQNEPPKYTVTPVRRSNRLSAHWSGKRTPLQICSSVKQAGLLGETVFVPNSNLFGTP